MRRRHERNDDGGDGAEESEHGPTDASADRAEGSTGREAALVDAGRASEEQRAGDEERAQQQDDAGDLATQMRAPRGLRYLLRRRSRFLDLVAPGARAARRRRERRVKQQIVVL